MIIQCLVIIFLFIFNIYFKEDEENYSSQESVEEDIDIEKEVISLGVKLAQAKSKLIMIEKENDVLSELRKDLKTELIKINAKINESEILNKFLLENNSSKEDLFDKILDQIKVLRQLKLEGKKKNEKVKNSIIEFLTDEQKEKGLLVEQGVEMKEFLIKIKEQIKALNVPNFDNLVKNKIDLEKLINHNKELNELEQLNEKMESSNKNQNSDSKNINFLRRSVNYSSTGI